MDFDLGREIGAEEGFFIQRLTLYLPNKDKNGLILPNTKEWIDEARELLSQIGGGATAYPPADGNWIDEAGVNLWEETRIIYCFVDPDRLRTKSGLLRDFLHRFGRETNQGEVVVEFDERFWRIKRFDVPNGV